MSAGDKDLIQICDIPEICKHNAIFYWCSGLLWRVNTGLLVSRMMCSIMLGVQDMILQQSSKLDTSFELCAMSRQMTSREYC